MPEREPSKDVESEPGRLASWREGLRSGGLGAAIQRRLRRHSGTDELAAEIARHLKGVGRYMEANDRKVDRVQRLVAIGPVMDWIEQATLLTSPLVSVVMPTRNRSALLPRATGSVLAQSYPEWELVIVDDGSEDGTLELLESLPDSRIRPLRVDHGGVTAARNAGLEAARGELIAYLDDDNAMHPGWLKSLVWAFEQRPDVEVLYGATLIDDVERHADGSPGGFPIAHLSPFDRERLSEENPTDMSAMAHRAGLPEARFDESLVTMGDWDLLARLCAERDPLVLPVIACFYTTGSADRLTGGPTEADDAATVRERARGPGSSDGG